MGGGLLTTTGRYGEETSLDENSGFSKGSLKPFELVLEYVNYHA